MEMKFKSANLHQSILNTLYSDRSLSDAVIKVNGGSYPCHAAVLAATSSLLHGALNDPQIDNLNELITIIMADWTPTDAELYIKQSYNQVDLILPEDLVKVESILTFKEVKPDIATLESKLEVENGHDIFFNDYFENDMNDITFEDDDDFIKPNIKKKSKNKIKSNLKKKVKQKKDKILLEGICEYCSNSYKNLREHKLEKHMDLIKEKENINSSYPQDCPFCGKFLLNRRFKGRHKCFKLSKTIVDYRKARNNEGKEKLEKQINEELEERVNDDGVKQETDFICHLCGVHCPSKSSLTNHLNMNCSNVCEICKEILANKSEVKQHMFLVHKKVKTTFHNNAELNFSCTQCDKKYASMHTLNNHIKKAHTQEVTKVQCPDCGNLFSSGAALRKHASLHKPPELPCPICGKLFHNQTYLMRHANSVHADAEDKKFKCEVCGKGFTNKHALEGHHNWHYNLKPFRCRWCERNYQNQSNCNAHERKSHKLEYQATLTKGNRRIQVDSSKDKYVTSNNSITQT